MAAINTQDIDFGGNDIICNSIEVGAQTPGDSGVGVCTIYSGTGVPSFLATQGSVYLRTDGAGIGTRMYINTTGSTVWTGVTTAG